MNAATLDVLRPRKPDRLTRGALLALLAHALLVIALTLGVSWRTSEPAGVEAELWAAVPQAAAPRAVEPEPPKPAPPEPKPEPKPQPEAKVEPPPPNRDAEIAREKKEQKEKLEKQRIEEEKREADKKRKEAEDKQREEQQQAKLEADKKKKAEAQRLAQLEAQRQENLKRILGQADATGSATDTGTAAQSAGPSANYAGRIKARIKPNIVFGDEVATNPVASVQVRVAPDGTIMGRQLVKSSGIASWDDAVLRAIDKTETLPRDTDGRVPPSMVIDFRPRDF